jgi:predicted nucleotidyltransferase
VNIEELADGVRAAIEPISEVRVAWLFGSRASGCARPDSDLDVAVAFESRLDDIARGQARLDVLEALARALGELGETADVVDVDAAPSALVFGLLLSGHRLLARSEAERVETDVRIMRRYYDEAPMRELYRRAALDAVHRMGTQGQR